MRGLAATQIVQSSPLTALIRSISAEPYLVTSNSAGSPAGSIEKKKGRESWQALVVVLPNFSPFLRLRYANGWHGRACHSLLSPSLIPTTKVIRRESNCKQECRGKMRKTSALRNCVVGTEAMRAPSLAKNSARGVRNRTRSTRNNERSRLDGLLAPEPWQRCIDARDWVRTEPIPALTFCQRENRRLMALSVVRRPSTRAEGGR